MLNESGLKGDTFSVNTLVKQKVGVVVVFADGPRTLARNLGIGFEIRPDTVALSAIFEIEWKNNPLDSFDFFFSLAISNSSTAFRYNLFASFKCNCASLILLSPFYLISRAFACALYEALSICTLHFAIKCSKSTGF